jgi:molecular chaperone DnaK
VPQIEVTFDIDANGILQVSAKERGSGNEQQIRIEGGSGLNEDEIQRMVKDAESHSDEDRAAKDLAVARNEAESTVYDVTKSLSEHGDKVDAETREGIESAISNVRSVLEGGDAAAITASTQALREASFKLAEVIYAQSGSQPGNESPSSDADGPDEEIIEDAEVVDPDAARS